MLLFIAQFLDFASTVMTTVVLLALVHGVSVTRPQVPPDSDERPALLRAVGIFATTCMISTLSCGFQLDDKLAPFRLTLGPASYPYIFARGLLAVFCFQKGTKMAVSPEGANKKQSLVRWSLLSLIWLGFLPVCIIFSGAESSKLAVFTLETANLSIVCLLLYFFWPSRFGTLFSCTRPTDKLHPFSEFGLPS